MSTIKQFFFLFILFSFIYTFDIPMRNSSYKLHDDCFDGNNKKDKPGSISFAQDCTDYKPHKKFKCCFVHIFDDSSNSNSEGESEGQNYCMLVKKGNKTDLNELKAFVSTQAPYAVVTCSQKNINNNNILVFLLFFLFFI